jgi:hypothetical protein
MSAKAPEFVSVRPVSMFGVADASKKVCCINIMSHTYEIASFTWFCSKVRATCWMQPLLKESFCKRAVTALGLIAWAVSNSLMHQIRVKFMSQTNWSLQLRVSQNNSQQLLGECPIVLTHAFSKSRISSSRHHANTPVAASWGSSLPKSSWWPKYVNIKIVLYFFSLSW